METDELFSEEKNTFLKVDLTEETVGLVEVLFLKGLPQNTTYEKLKVEIL